jgi:multidrug resistance efflux pump
MRKLNLVIMVGALALFLFGCEGTQEETPTPEVENDYVPVVSVTGEVVPAVWTTVSARIGGPVIELPVEPGDEVAAGDLLVRLDCTDAELAVRQAELAVEAAQAQLALVEASPLPEQVAVAEVQIEAARAAISQTVAQRDQLLTGPTQAEIAAAQAQIAAAEVEQWMAREAHDQTMKCYEVPKEGGGKKTVCPTLGTLEEQTRFQLHAANEALAAAKAQLNRLYAGADANEIRAAEAAVAAAEVQQRVAQAQLELIQAGPIAAETDAANVSVAQAEAGLEAARVALEYCEVHAPYAGTVGAVDVRPGELIAAGQPLITLGDLATLRVETTDLDEIDVGRVAVGQKAAITVDALPDRVFTAHVTRISPMANPGTGGVNYTAILELDTLDPAILWGMTAFVDIEVE